MQIYLLFMRNRKTKKQLQQMQILLLIMRNPEDQKTTATNADAEPEDF